MEHNRAAYKAQQMFGLIENWQQSGINQHAFCKASNIAYSKFHYWHKRYRQHQLGNPVGVGFKKIEIAEQLELASPPSAWLVVHCTDGRQFSFHQPLAADLLRQLMH
jgi:hypothetical protein